MSPDNAALTDDEETIVEFVVRERLNREQIVDLSISLGGPKQGGKAELAEKLLAIRGLKAKDVLMKLSVDDLKVVVRRFGIPEPPKPTTPSGFLGSILSDEKSGLVKRIEEAASKQRAPRPSTGPRADSPTPAAEITTHAAVAKSSVATPSVAEPPAPAPAPPPRAPDPVQPARSHSPAPPLVSGNDAAQFEDLCKFLDGYNFTKRWDSEDLYEAELGGAISGHFRGQKVVHQMAVGGTKADIVALGAVIEIKYPKTRQPLQTLVGQVEDYQRLFANRVVVVLCSGGLRETQAFNDSAATLSERGVKVYIK